MGAGQPSPGILPLHGALPQSGREAQGLFQGAAAAADGVAAAACRLHTTSLCLLLSQGMYTAGVVLMVPAMVMAMAAGAVFGMVRPLCVLRSCSAVVPGVTMLACAPAVHLQADH